MAQPDVLTAEELQRRLSQLTEAERQLPVCLIGRYDLATKVYIERNVLVAHDRRDVLVIEG